MTVLILLCLNVLLYEGINPGVSYKILSRNVWLTWHSNPGFHRNNGQISKLAKGFKNRYTMCSPAI